MTDTRTDRLRGTDPAVVGEALESGDPLPGTGGFAGAVDGRLVRDVLGRLPLFVERSVAVGDDASAPADAGTPTDVPFPASDRWAFSPGSLADPVPFPAGTVRSPAGRDRVWRLPDPDPDEDRGRALDRAARAIGTAVEAVRAADLDTAVAFSGGVDSALVAALLDAPLYVAGFPDSRDVEAARTAAAAMGRADDLSVVEIAHADLERAVPEVARATGRTNAMDVGIALPLYLVGERAAADGFDRLAVGQGADELFGGYEKVARLDHRVEADTVRGAVREQIHTLPEQLPRDVLALEAAGVEPVAPLLHDAVVGAALRLPPDLLVDDGARKRGLRLVAEDRLPAEVAWREKKAVQYGSLVARELDRLARRAGYKRRMDDHVTRYVRSLLDDTGAGGENADGA